MDALGKSPIPVPMLILGKFCLLLCWLFFLVKNNGTEMIFDSPTTQAIALLLSAIGFGIVVFGFIYLGKSVSVGLPKVRTELKTSGIYHITRNPLYLGAFLICIGSCLYSIHVVNFLFCIAGIGIHHWIITKEEKFLEERFGEQWIEYKKKTPRYLLF